MRPLLYLQYIMRAGPREDVVALPPFLKLKGQTPRVSSSIVHRHWAAKR